MELAFEKADSLVKLTKQFREMSKASEELFKDIFDSTTVVRYYVPEQDKRSRGIAGGVIKYELGWYSDSALKYHKIDYYLYYSLKEEKFVKALDRQNESISPEMEIQLKRADSVVKNSKEYKQITDSLVRDDWDLVIRFTDPDSSGLISYRIGGCRVGIPHCAGPFYIYEFIYSIEKSQIIAVNKMDEYK
jgi:hypothetical protein